MIDDNLNCDGEEGSILLDENNATFLQYDIFFVRSNDDQVSNFFVIGITKRKKKLFFFDLLICSCFFGNRKIKCQKMTKNSLFFVFEIEEWFSFGRTVV